MIFFACGNGKLTVDKNVNKNTKDVLVYDTDDLTYEKSNGIELLDFASKNKRYFTPFYNEDKNIVEMCNDYAVVHDDIQFYRHDNLMIVFAMKGVCCLYRSFSGCLYINGDEYIGKVSKFSNPYYDNGNLYIRINSKPYLLEKFMKDTTMGVSCSDLVLYKRKAEIELDSAVNYMLEVIDVSMLL